MHLRGKLSRHHSRSIMYKIMTGMTVIIFSSGTRTSQLTQTLELQIQPRPKQSTTRLFLALLCQEQRRLQVSHQLVITQKILQISTFLAVSTRVGISTPTAGEQAALYSSMRLGLEIPTVNVEELAIFCIPPSMATIGSPGLIPHPTVVTLSSVMSA